MTCKSNNLLAEGQNFNIEYLKEKVSDNMPDSHYHDHYEIYYQISGERNYFIQDSIYNIKKGDIVLINLHTIHKTVSSTTPSYGRILIDFRKEFLDDFIKNIKDIDLFSCIKKDASIISLSLNDQNLIEGLLFRMLDENKKIHSGSATYLRLLMIELLINLSRYPLNSYKSESDNSNPVYKKISGIAQYISTNYAEKITLKDISDRFFISPYYFCRIFKKTTGSTFTEYLNRIRTREAQTLLRQSDLSLTEVAEKTGFDSLTHFGRVFKSITHLSPSKYRKIGML